MIAESKRRAGLLFHVMRFALHDGPGIRTTIFFKGCPLACHWCHNPESQSTSVEVLYSPERCLRCGGCAIACPEGAIEFGDAGVAVSGSCRHCGACAEACPAEARQAAGRVWSVPEVLAEIERDRVLYDESGGGVTFSGGEPLAQPEFLEELLGECRRRGIPTAVETCGMASREAMLRVGRLAGLILFDLKLIDVARHRQYTGAGNRHILSNLRALLAEHAEVVVRIPLVPGINDSAEDVAAFREFLSDRPVRRIDLLPYHKTGIDKYRRLGRPYRLEQVEPPGAAHVDQVARELEKTGIPVRVGS